MLFRSVLGEFTKFIAQTAWNILRDQGFDVEKLGTHFREMWCQELNQYQAHEEHVHSHGDQISGVYILECPEGGSQLAIHDPRPGKSQINLPETDKSAITYASRTALLTAKPGRFYFFNSWLPHSITRNPLQTPTRLVHFNLTVAALPASSEAIVVRSEEHTSELQSH